MYLDVDPLMDTPSIRGIYDISLTQDIIVHKEKEDRIYESFFGILSTDEKKRFIRMMSTPNEKIDRHRARILRLCASSNLSEEEILHRLAFKKDGSASSNLWNNKLKEFYRKEESFKTTRHHIRPKVRGGTLQHDNRINLETEIHVQLHFIFGVMLYDEKCELIDRYDRPPYQIITDERIPYRHHPNERLLLRNIRISIMQELFSKRLAYENERAANQRLAV